MSENFVHPFLLTTDNIFHDEKKDTSTRIPVMINEGPNTTANPYVPMKSMRSQNFGVGQR